MEISFLRAPFDSLAVIEPSLFPHHGIPLFPCSVTMKSGAIHDRVYILARSDLDRLWRPASVPPEKVLQPTEIQSVRESPYRPRRGSRTKSTRAVSLSPTRTHLGLSFPGGLGERI